MKRLTSRDLNRSTGEVVRTLKRGESILITFRIGHRCPARLRAPRVSHP